MDNLIKIKDLPNGVIIWKGNLPWIITGTNHDPKYLELYVKKVPGNIFDYELIVEKEK